jgi:hypothetical protein
MTNAMKPTATQAGEFNLRVITDAHVKAIAAAIRAPKRRHALALRLLGNLATSIIHYQAMSELGALGKSSHCEQRLKADLDEVSSFLRGGVE